MTKVISEPRTLGAPLPDDSLGWEIARIVIGDDYELPEVYFWIAFDTSAAEKHARLRGDARKPEGRAVFTREEIRTLKNLHEHSPASALYTLLCLLIESKLAGLGPVEWTGTSAEARRRWPPMDDGPSMADEEALNIWDADEEKEP